MTAGTHARLTGDADLTRDVDNLTADSITVVHLGPDHPPMGKTVYGTVPDSDLQSPLYRHDRRRSVRIRTQYGPLYVRRSGGAGRAPA